MNGQSDILQQVQCVALRDPAKPRVRFYRRIVFLLVSLGILFGVAEVAARIGLYLGGVDQGLMYTWHRNKRLSGTWVEQDRDYPYLPYVPKVKAPDVGMCDLQLTSPDEVKPDHVFRIFCLGGSTTWYGYPRELRARLGPYFESRGMQLEVVNAANVSWTSAESLVNFALRCLPYEPDAIILYHAVNDCWPAFGTTWQADYSHWRKRLIAREPIGWDYLPKFLDASAAFVRFRSWFEIPARYAMWERAMMHYVPDFENDPYHGVEPYRRNISSLLAIAAANDIPVFLSTQVYNEDEPRRRLVAAVREVNDITRELAESTVGVHFIDAAKSIPGSDELLFDICHFRKDRDGQSQLVELFTKSIRPHIDEMIGGHAASRSRRNAR